MTSQLPTAPLGVGGTRGWGHPGCPRGLAVEVPAPLAPLARGSGGPWVTTAKRGLQFRANGVFCATTPPYVEYSRVVPHLNIFRRCYFLNPMRLSGGGLLVTGTARRGWIPPSAARSPRPRGEKGRGRDLLGITVRSRDDGGSYTK